MLSASDLLFIVGVTVVGGIIGAAVSIFCSIKKSKKNEKKENENNKTK